MALIQYPKITIAATLCGIDLGNYVKIDNVGAKLDVCYYTDANTFSQLAWDADGLSIYSLDNNVGIKYVDDISFTGDTENGSDIISNIENTATLMCGQSITGAGIPAETYIDTILTEYSVHITAAATANNVGASFTGSGGNFMIMKTEGSCTIAAYYKTLEVTCNIKQEFVIYNNFFKDNYLSIISEYDKQNINNNTYTRILFDTCMEFFDILYAYQSDVREVRDAINSKYKFLNALGSSLGFGSIRSPRSPVSTEIISIRLYRELLNNLIDLLKIRGTLLSYELFFGALGYDIEVQEYWFNEDGNLLEINATDDSLSTFYGIRTDGTPLDETPTEYLDPRRLSSPLNRYDYCQKSPYIKVTFTPRPEFGESISYSYEQRLLLREYLALLKPLHIRYLEDIITVVLPQTSTCIASQRLSRLTPFIGTMTCSTDGLPAGSYPIAVYINLVPINITLEVEASVTTWNNIIEQMNVELGIYATAAITDGAISVTADTAGQSLRISALSLLEALNTPSIVASLGYGYSGGDDIPMLIDSDAQLSLCNLLMPYAFSTWTVPAKSATIFGDTHNGTAIIDNIFDTSVIDTGWTVTGTGIPSSTKIRYILGIHSIKLNKDCTITGSAVEISASHPGGSALDYRPIKISDTNVLSRLPYNYTRRQGGAGGYDFPPDPGRMDYVGPSEHGVWEESGGGAVAEVLKLKYFTESLVLSYPISIGELLGTTPLYDGNLYYDGYIYDPVALGASPDQPSEQTIEQRPLTTSEEAELRILQIAIENGDELTPAQEERYNYLRYAKYGYGYDTPPQYWSDNGNIPNTPGTALRWMGTSNTFERPATTDLVYDIGIIFAEEPIQAVNIVAFQDRYDELKYAGYSEAIIEAMLIEEFSVTETQYDYLLTAET